jgi:peptide/nickel transport system permease protein
VAGPRWEAAPPGQSPAPVLAGADPLPGRPWRRKAPAATRHPARQPLFVVGLVITVGFVLVGLVGPMLAPHDPVQQDLALRLKPPGTVLANGDTYLLGTDQLGRDVLSRLMAGTRISLIVATLAVFIGLVLGTALGIVAGYLGGVWDAVTMRLVDLQMAFPFIFLGFLVVGLFGRGLLNTILVLGLWGWVAYARIARGMSLSLRHREFMEAAVATGCGRPRILFRHVLPNLADVLVVFASLQVGRMLVAQAGLEFLGLGVEPPQPVWGGMLNEGRNYVRQAWWMGVAPGLAITTVVVGLSMFGNGLRRILEGSR